jgi:hypothetical protein
MEYPEPGGTKNSGSKDIDTGVVSPGPKANPPPSTSMVTIIGELSGTSNVVGTI